MKIIYCLHGTCKPGGMERMVVAKANALADLGHKVIIVTTDQGGRPDFFPLDPKVRRLDSNIMYGDNRTRNPLLKYIVRRNKIKRHRQFVAHLIESFKPDIVVSTVGNEVNFIPEIAGNAATVAEIHFSKFYRLQFERKGIWRYIDRYLTFTDERALAKYDRLVVLTEADAKHWIGSKNLVVITNFINTSQRPKSPLTKKRVIAIGHLDFQKNFGEMIEVWRMLQPSHPDWTLHIYGDGTEKAHLQRLIDSYGLTGNIVLEGTTPPDAEIFSDASILLHTARYEGLPLVLLEAMSAGVPVVAYDCPCGPAEIIEDGVTGFLIPQGDRQAMVAGLRKLIEDEDLRRRMGDDSVRSAARFAPEAIIERWVELFTALRPGIQAEADSTEENSGVDTII